MEVEESLSVFEVNFPDVVSGLASNNGSSLREPLSLILKTFHDSLSQKFFQNKMKIKKNKKNFDSLPLNSLHVQDHLHLEQIWEELQLQNQPVLFDLADRIAKITKITDNLVDIDEGGEVNKPGESKKDFDSDSQQEEGQQESGEDEDALSEQEGEERKKADISHGRSGEEPVFFSIGALEKFVQAMEEKEMEDEEKADEEDEDEEEMSGEEETPEAVDYTYADFFDPPEDIDHEQEEEELLEDEDVEEEEEEDPVQARKEAWIAKLEEKNVAEKHWSMKGEVSSKARPHDSLLETRVEFDSATKIKPPVTEEFTASLEDLIKRRIEEGSWNDPEEVTPSKEIRASKRRKLGNEPETLDFEKSKIGLAEQFERQFLEAKEKEKKRKREEDERGVASLVDEDEQEGPKLNDKQKLVVQLFDKISYELDCLSGLRSGRSHYDISSQKALLRKMDQEGAGETGKVNKNLKVRSAVEREDVAPVTVSDANILAPEEVFNPPKGNIKGTSEVTATDKHRKRRSAKRKRKGRLRNREKIPQPEHTAVKIQEGRGVTGGSTALFRKLQEEVDLQHHSLKQDKKSEERSFTSSSLKL